MGLFAIVNNNLVENIIVLDGDQLTEMESALDSELVDALPLGLCKGDQRVGGVWTRNLNGEQVVLEEIDVEQQFDYKTLVNDLEGKSFIVNNSESAFTEGVNSIVNEDVEEEAEILSTDVEEETEGEQALELLNNIENSLREGVESVG